MGDQSDSDKNARTKLKNKIIEIEKKNTTLVKETTVLKEEKIVIKEKLVEAQEKNVKLEGSHWIKIKPAKEVLAGRKIGGRSLTKEQLEDLVNELREELDAIRKLLDDQQTNLASSVLEGENILGEEVKTLVPYADIIKKILVETP